MELIEGELPRFVATIHQELAASRDVLRILENYKKHSGPDFGRELDVLTADMRSSSYEAALIRFEARMAPPSFRTSSAASSAYCGVTTGECTSRCCPTI